MEDNGNRLMILSGQITLFHSLEITTHDSSETTTWGHYHLLSFAQNWEYIPIHVPIKNELHMDN